MHAGDHEGWVVGRTTGLRIPAHRAALEEGGAAFLEQAFRAYGTLAANNGIVGIRAIEACRIGSSGEKLFLSVDYRHDEPQLPRELFVKFSRHFDDPFHDRRRFELESEIRLFALSRSVAFPVPVPRAMFGDFDPESGSGILVTERIFFGRDGVEPFCVKCMDHELAHPLDHYRAIVVALARLAAAHQSGRLGDEVDRLFPLDRAAALAEDPIPWSEAEMLALVARYRGFVERSPQLIPARLRAPDFIARLEKNLPLLRRCETAIKRFMQADRRYVALSHFNAHIDNAWFYRDADGVLACGLFDWQRARQMNLGAALWGALSGAGQDIWTNHLDELLQLFVDELAAGGGERLEPKRLALHVHLYAATMGTVGMLGAPDVILSRLPGAVDAAGPRDPALLANEGARSILHVLTNYLLLWSLHDFDTRFAELLDDVVNRTAA